MISVPSDILDFCPSIFKSDFQCVDIPWLEVKPLYAFIEKMPFLALLVEFKVALLLNEPLAGFGIGAYDEGFYITVSRGDRSDCSVSTASDGESEED